MDKPFAMKPSADPVTTDAIEIVALRLSDIAGAGDHLLNALTRSAHPRGRENRPLREQRTHASPFQPCPSTRRRWRVRPLAASEAPTPGRHDNNMHRQPAAPPLPTVVSAGSVAALRLARIRR